MDQTVVDIHTDAVDIYAVVPLVRKKHGAAIYVQLKTTEEPVNGQIKEAQGLRCVLLGRDS